MVTAVTATAVVAAIVLWGLLAKQTVVIKPAAYDGPLGNPMTGFAPAADNHDRVGDSRLVYVDVTWREFEPEQGKYDFASLEASNHLDEWRVKGKQVVFRFLCDVPGESWHTDIPGWLYTATNGDGDWYSTEYGRGYSPNYANPMMIRLHRLAIQALGEHYGKDNFFCYIELGSLGHWGEWHTKYDEGIARMPLKAVRDQYIEPYLNRFPNAKLLMRRPFLGAAEHGMGLFNDMAGEPQSTAQWLGWISNGGKYEETGEAEAMVPMPDAWKTSPIGGELAGSIPSEEMFGGQLKNTIKLIRDSHMTFLGPNCPALPGDAAEPEGIQAVLASLGSRLRIDRAELQQPLLLPGNLMVRLQWVNDGSAPFYQDWDAVLYLLDSKGAEVCRSLVDISIPSVMDSRAKSSITTLPTQNLPDGPYTLALAILDPDTGFPAISFAMEGMRPDHLCLLGEWNKD